MVEASSVVESGLSGLWASTVTAHGFSSCGTQAPLLQGMWNLPTPGIKPVSPLLTGRILSTVLPGVFCDFTFILNLIVYKNKLDDFRVFFLFVCLFSIFLVMLLLKQGRNTGRISERRLIFAVSQTKKRCWVGNGVAVDPLLKHNQTEERTFKHI